MKLPGKTTALLLAGGGARTAYQVGLLRSLVRAYPDLHFPILTGVSAGAINIAHLANNTSPLPASLDRLEELWLSLTIDQVLRSNWRTIRSSISHWLLRLVWKNAEVSPPIRGMADNAPLGDFLRRALESPDGNLPGIDENIRTGQLEAIGVTTTGYPDGESVTWVQGNSGIADWQRTGHRGVRTQLTVDHILASSALPLVFPATELAGTWQGDGGIRLTAPLAPAVQMGADRILAISPLLAPGRPGPTDATSEYPRPATVISVLLNSIFLDVLERDAAELRRLNRLIGEYPGSQTLGFRPVDVLIIRPSIDLNLVAADYTRDLPPVLRRISRILGGRNSKRADIVATLLFDPRYIRKVIEIGESDGTARADEIGAFLGCTPRRPAKRVEAPRENTVCLAA